MIESEEKNGLGISVDNCKSKKKKIKLTEEKKWILQENIKYLVDNFQWFKELDGEIEEYSWLFEEWYREWDFTIDLYFPAEDDSYNINIYDFNTYIDEYKTLNFVDNIYITNKYAYLKVIPNFTEENYNLYMENCWEVFTSNNISVSYEEWSFIPALDIIQEEGYDEDRWI